MGLIGQKVDTIEYYDNMIRELVPKLESEQKVTLRDKHLSAAIVFFTSRAAAAAAAAAQSLHNTMVDHWTVVEAPKPSNCYGPTCPRTSTRE